jgi:ribosomal protein L40E
MSKKVANIEGKIVCDKCGYLNEPGAQECAKCKGKRFAPQWVIQKRPINRQLSVDVTMTDPKYGPPEKRITLSKWWPGDSATFNIPTLKQWRSIKRIIDTDLAPLLGWTSKEGYEAESDTEIPASIKDIDLPDKDAKSLLKLMPILQKYDIRNINDLKRLIAGRRVFHYMRLEKVLKEFEKRLKTKANEPEWQTFFKENLLILNPGYMKIIERPNVSLAMKFPDFLLINIEGYADLYEIKTPTTPLLAYDRSHKNYYWSSDISKAISQVENYVDSLNKNSPGLIEVLKDQIELKFVRPRGYIIAGHSNQLKEPNKNDYFRLLNESLKSTEVLPYDNFLERFKSFSKTLKEGS